MPKRTHIPNDRRDAPLCLGVAQPEHCFPMSTVVVSVLGGFVPGVLFAWACVRG